MVNFIFINVLDRLLQPIINFRFKIFMAHALVVAPPNPKTPRTKSFCSHTLMQDFLREFIKNSIR